MLNLIHWGNAGENLSEIEPHNKPPSGGLKQDTIADVSENAWSGSSKVLFDVSY